MKDTTASPDLKTIPQASSTEAMPLSALKQVPAAVLCESVFIAFSLLNVLARQPRPSPMVLNAVAYVTATLPTRSSARIG